MDEEFQACKFFSRWGRDDEGLCRRYPPVYVGDAGVIDDEPYAAWCLPLVDTTHWCGEWQPADESRP